MSKRILAENLAALMRYKEVKSSRAMSMEPGCAVSDRMIGHILNQTSTPTIEVLDRLADYFKIPSWVLLVDGITPEDMQNAQLKKLVAGYLDSEPEGRDILSKLASRESDYATVNEPAMPSTKHRLQPPGRRRRKNERG